MMLPILRRFGGLLLGAALAACQSGESETLLSGEVQGTSYHIKMVLDGLQVNQAELKQAIDAAYNDIDLKLSNYREDSEISRINREATTDWLAVSPEIAELVDIARQVHDKTEGCYDLTIKPLFDLWGFSRHQNRVPTDAEIAAVLPHIGMDKLEVDVPGHRLRKKDPALRIDLSSIAQGYTVGRVAGLLEAKGIRNYLVEVGGEMQVKGRKANGNPWRVAVEKPTPYTREVERILDIHQTTGTAIMTSGTYRNFFKDKGKAYSHIIDPKTGRPVDHHLLSTTLLHPDPTWADAWSTALLCLGEQKGYAVAEQEGLKALLIYGENGELKERFTPAFGAEMASPPPAGPAIEPH
ncbi:FAD:protein FMN transferase [Methylococcus geothermalis]|uniref:FAD:protein FMN transferase n=1 Tax=Methylococcus geothermalis TaxID=2681310 RepID=A0A858Q5C5_9GAMM|nr:FAD:protein FMN transferase [Methylococcus geothermalis]QJD29038.1 FAD:protein FMN transferase [Methylococcus geothermalis]